MNSSTIDYRDMDKRIWEEELAEFLPQRLFDAHAHFLESAHLPADLPDRDTKMPENLDIHREWAKRLYPGREIHYFFLGWPIVGIDEEAHNRDLAGEVKKDPGSRAAMLIMPQMSPDYVKTMIDRYGFKGFKPYRVYSVTGDAVNCRIADYLPERLIEVANEYGIRVVLHLSKKTGCADEDNLKDLEFFSKKYPKVKWQLAHCARSFAYWMIEQAVDRLREIPGVYYDLSAVNDVMSFYILFKKERRDRLLWGSDGVFATFRHGKFFTYAYAWAYVWEKDLDALNLSHCEREPTMIIYEQLRAIRQAAEMAGLSRQEIENIFWGNAEKIILQ